MQEGPGKGKHASTKARGEKDWTCVRSQKKAGVVGACGRDGEQVEMISRLIN